MASQSDQGPVPPDPLQHEVVAGGGSPELVPASRQRRPWVTGLVCLTMVALFLAVSLDPRGGTEALFRWGWRDAARVWSGNAWALLTSSFIHFYLWHLALNVYWMWRLGSVVERECGPLAVALLLAASSVVGSATQLAIFDDTGCGASAMVFALFSFIILARKKVGAFKTAFTTKEVVLFATFFVGCWIVLPRVIANGAHLGGLAVGALAAEGWFTGRRPRLAKVGAASLLLLAVALGFVCPWSPIWWSTKGYQAHSQGDCDVAIEAYEMSLKLRPDQSWVLGNLIRCHWAQGQCALAAPILSRLRSVSAEEAEKIEKEDEKCRPAPGRAP